MPFAGIAFLWFIGVVRDQLGESEDRLFSTVFLGSGLLFVAMLFEGAVTTDSLMTMVARPDVDTNLWLFGRDSTQTLVSVYALRMAAVFTLSVSTVGVTHRRGSEMGRLPRIRHGTRPPLSLPGSIDGSSWSSRSGSFLSAS